MYSFSNYYLVGGIGRKRIIVKTRKSSMIKNCKLKWEEETNFRRSGAVEHLNLPEAKKIKKIGKGTLRRWQLVVNCRYWYILC